MSASWSQHIKTIEVYPQTDKDGNVGFGLSFYGGLENGMFIRCKQIGKVHYGDSYYQPPSWSPAKWMRELRLYYGGTIKPGEISCFGHHIAYTNRMELFCEHDIVINFNGLPAFGLPLDFVEKIKLKSMAARECCLIEIVSPGFFPGCSTEGSPTELADYLKIQYPMKSDEERTQADIRHHAYSILPAFTTRERYATPNIFGFPVSYMFISPQEFVNLEANNRVLEHGVLNGNIYGTLTSDISVCSEAQQKKLFGMEGLVPRTLSFYEALDLEPRLGYDGPYIPSYATKIWVKCDTNQQNANINSKSVRETVQRKLRDKSQLTWTKLKSLFSRRKRPS